MSAPCGAIHLEARTHVVRDHLQRQHLKARRRQLVARPGWQIVMRNRQLPAIRGLKHSGEIQRCIHPRPETALHPARKVRAANPYHPSIRAEKKLGPYTGPSCPVRILPNLLVQLVEIMGHIRRGDEDFAHRSGLMRPHAAGVHT